MKGRRTCRGLTANCARMELPRVSAVMPVPSDTKKTLRSDMVRLRLPGKSVKTPGQGLWKELEQARIIGCPLQSDQLSAQIAWRPHKHNSRPRMGSAQTS